mgnify:FL=1
MSKEDILRNILDRLEVLKDEFQAVIDEYDNDYAEDEVMNLLVDASGSFDDTIDCIYEALEK